ncbi:hypothetical protein [Flavobacterium sp.]|uniref:hypothetical protein n=1 Tax=Flavobacterium sp. TaxID=239 RepID=UPI00326676CC
MEQRTKNGKQKAVGKKKDFIQIRHVFILFFIFSSLIANAQCAMCRAALAGESNIKKAEAVNDGIVYLMVVPYLLVVIIGILIYKMYQSKKKRAA